MTIGEMLQQTAAQYPAQEVMVYKTDRVTYHSAYQRACQFAWLLVQRGICPGDRVALLLKNSPTYLAAYFGALGAGAIVVPMNPETTMYELQHLLTDSGAKALICHSAGLSILQPVLAHLPNLRFLLVEMDTSPEQHPQVEIVSLGQVLRRDTKVLKFPWEGNDNDLAQIIYTSGTTGKPKGIMLTHRNLMANTRSIVTYLHLTVHDRLLVILPFFYSYGNSLLLTHVYVGGTLVIGDQFVYLNKLVELMIREGVTGFSGVPSSYAMLLRQSVFPKTTFDTLRYVTCAGGALAKSLIEELQTCLPHTEIHIMYGQTEASARLSYLEPIDLPRKIGSIGKGIPGVALKVLNRDGIEVAPGEVGEIVAEGENVMQGYWNNPVATLKVLKGRRLYTGDLATVDDDGFIYIVGRQSDLIKSGSYRIHPGEIEEVLNAHPCILESAVVGVEDKILGEAVTAYVVTRPSHTLTQPELLQFARGFLPSYKMPKRVLFIEQLPKTASGKIKRNILREQWEVRV
jgi:acyl-CoA synthetase (AMP-forming)/AMP-acid ligase II